MAEIQVFKTKITNACVLIKSSEPQITNLDQAFTFPQQIEECRAYIAEKTAQLNNLTRTISSAKQFHDSCVKGAIETINGRAEHKEREKLMMDLNRHLESESNSLEIKVIQWLNQIDFRKEELLQQTSLLASSTPPHSQAVANTNNSCQEWSSGAIAPQERNVRVRRPLLEVPTFSGNHRDVNTFWSVFESLIHNDADLSDQEKFLFLKQALKGKAAASISSIPVMGTKYATAVSILKKHYDRSASIADILISEIERLPRALGNPKSCRGTLEAISSRIIHVEQTGVPMNADRMWRRLILSKFTESICGTVITKENEAGIPFDANRIIDSIDEIITLQETIELTTRTLFGSDQSNYRCQQESTPDNGLYFKQRIKRACLCGEIHSPQECHKFDSPEQRRAEAKRQRVCWRCFSKGHSSRLCSTAGKCQKCNEDYHSSLCASTGNRQPTANTSIQRSSLSSTTHFRPAPRSTISMSSNCFMLLSGESYQRRTRHVRGLPNKSPQKNIVAESHLPTLRQPVLQLKSTNPDSETGCSSIIIATPLISFEDDYKTEKHHESESLVSNAECGRDDAPTYTFADNHRKAITTKEKNITGVPSTEDIKVIEDNLNVAINGENICLQPTDDAGCDHKTTNIEAKMNSSNNKLIKSIQDYSITASPPQDYCNSISENGVALSCYSQGQVFADTEDDRPTFPMECKSSTLQTTTKIYETALKYADICQTTCDKEGYNVIPELRAFHTHWNASSDVHMTTEGAILEHFLNFAFEHWTISNGSVETTAIVAIVLLVPKILSRILYYQLKTQTVLPLYLCANSISSLDLSYLMIT